MGNSDSIADKDFEKEKLTFIEIANFQGGNLVKVFKRGNKESYAISSPINKNFIKDQKALEKRLKIQHPHLMSVLGIDKAISDEDKHLYQNLQSEENLQKFFFQYSYITLESLLDERMGTERYFPEDDLEALLKGISSALYVLKKNQITNGDINTQTIYFDQYSGVFKIYDRELLCGRGSGYIQAMTNKRFSFLSPELIEYQRQRNFQISDEILNKSDIFALGFVLLEAASLQRMQLCYDHKYSIIDTVVQQRIQQIQEFYSPQFIYVIQQMINYDYTQRPDSEQLQKLIQDIYNPEVIENPNTEPIPLNNSNLILMSHNQIKISTKIQILNIKIQLGKITYHLHIMMTFQNI
ncbi:Protein kinase-like domain [Pseudocohnilembus persalinus]|uniref:Protein kinase-like domain n=1 Tax=Pseudocohnilembus persalinus TaxID=266149 RepID=A0A0V0R2D7_PSEPJ|nr:Protein kinase-like domain [Pseudocohnilembus persalinus]|eukprot:KRX08432.1 Protein kinase-like domain [Pseudocohnilembus persalinus]